MMSASSQANDECSEETSQVAPSWDTVTDRYAHSGSI